jgi:hypothetical protein
MVRLEIPNGADREKFTAALAVTRDKAGLHGLTIYDQIHGSDGKLISKDKDNGIYLNTGDLTPRVLQTLQDNSAAFHAVGATAAPGANTLSAKRSTAKRAASVIKPN